MPSEIARLRTHLPLRIAPRQIVQKRGGTLIGPRDVDQVAQVDRTVRGRNADDDVADGRRIRKQAGGIDHQVLRPDLERARRQGDVLRVENVFQLRRIVTVLRQTLLGVVEINLFLQHARAGDG